MTRFNKWRRVCFVISVSDSLWVFVLQVVPHSGPSPSRPAWRSTPPPWSLSLPKPQSLMKRTRRTMKFRKNHHHPPTPHSSTKNYNPHIYSDLCSCPHLSTFPIHIRKHHWPPFLNPPPTHPPIHNILLCLLTYCFKHTVTWIHPCWVFLAEV